MKDSKGRIACTGDFDARNTEEWLLMQVMHSRMSRGCNISE